VAALVLALVLGGCVYLHGNGDVRIGPFESERKIDVEGNGQAGPSLKRKTPSD
jgi:formylmethanofuran dehydrogenase subunit C